MTSNPMHLLSLDFCLFLLALYSGIQTCFGFNIDTRFPVVKEGQTSDSFFGFSVALLKQTEGADRYLLLSGAPREKASPVLKVYETGAVYYCPITNDTKDCTRVDLVKNDVLEEKESPAQEMVEDMWLGVTVASQGGPNGGRVLACGHRYVKILLSGSEKQRRMIGKCFVKGNNLSYDPNNDWQTHHYVVCNPANDMSSECMCTMGMSGGMTEKEVYTGTPGSFTWQGSVDMTWWNPKASWDLSERKYLNTDDNNNGQGRLIYSGRCNQFRPRYSVRKENNVLHADKYTVLAGAPRAYHKGAVFLMDINTNNVIGFNTILSGEQVGSYFGNNIAAADLNNDGQCLPFLILQNTQHCYDQVTVSRNIAISAPFDGSGKVFLYQSSEEGLSKEATQVIDGSDGIKTFGYSISGGLDVDENSYPDILVGSLDDKVPLLRARPVIQLSKTFTVSPGIVDPANCPDNSCCSPRVKFLKSSSPSVYQGFFSMPKTKCQAIKLILTVSSVVFFTYQHNIQDKLHSTEFALHYSIYEKKTRSHRDIQSLDGFPVLNEEQNHRDTQEIHFQKECGADNKCRSNLQIMAAFVSFTTGEELPRGALFELICTASPYILEFPGTPITQQPLQLFSNHRVSHAVWFIEHLREEFKRDELLELALFITKFLNNFSDILKFLHVPKIFPLSSLSSLSSLFSLPSSKAGKQMLQYSPDVKKLLLIVNVTNVRTNTREAEDTHQAILNITLPSTLQYSGVWKQSGSFLKPLESPFCTHEIEVELQLFTDKARQLTYFSGSVMGESAMKTAEDVGSPLEYTFHVSSHFGFLCGQYGTLAVVFDWPHEVSSGKWLLYLTEIVTKGTAESHCVPKGDIVNPLNLAVSV
ncbi:LOW QUALITY PROTEIN: integrin alpha-3-like [Polyodon spathula]|uniref:LOW QUALITY PROTEIN: integrin alpha-3-like n=1 Tax=Polyodon spathula TaxID=7913 RepID=UPI001B7F6544|nr:LOW QUALITY PROTEIN: integrin alpha-3-like [Polyodon spathula]